MSSPVRRQPPRGLGIKSQQRPRKKLRGRWFCWQVFFEAGNGACLLAAEAEHRVKAAQLFGRELVRDHQQQPAPDGKQQVLDPAGRRLVQVSQRLVQNQHIGIPQQRAGQADALFLAA